MLRLSVDEFLAWRGAKTLYVARDALLALPALATNRSEHRSLFPQTQS